MLVKSHRCCCKGIIEIRFGKKSKCPPYLVFLLVGNLQSVAFLSRFRLRLKGDRSHLTEEKQGKPQNIKPENQAL